MKSYTIAIFLICGLLHSKQIPGSSDGVLSTSYNGKYFALETYLALSIYDIEADSLVNSFDITPPYEPPAPLFNSPFSITNKHCNYYDSGVFIKQDILTGEVISKIPIGNKTNNEEVRSFTTFFGDYFLINTINSVYLAEDTEAGYNFKLLFRTANDFRTSRGGKGIYYNDGKIYHLDKNLILHSFNFDFENDIKDFNYRNGYLIYNYFVNNSGYIESYNLNNNTKKIIESNYSNDMTIVGSKLVTYRNIFWRDFNVLSLDLELESIIDIKSYSSSNNILEIDENRIVVSSDTESRSTLIDLDKHTQKRINRHSTTIQSFALSYDSKYVATISSSFIKELGKYIFQIIDVNSKEVLIEYYYDSFNYIEEIFYHKDYGFVFQSGDKELSYSRFDNGIIFRELINTEKDITSFNISDDYLIVGHENEFSYYDSNSLTKLGSVQTEGTVNLIRFNKIYSVVMSTLNGKSTIYRMNNTDFLIDSLSTIMDFRIGQEVVPKVTLSDSFLFFTDDENSVNLIRMDREFLGENRSIRIDNLGAIQSVSDSILICSFKEERQSIKKVKFDYENSSYETLKDYPLNLSRFRYYGDEKIEIPISRLVVEGNSIAYATYIENTIRLIEDENITSSVKRYEEIDLNTLRNYLINSTNQVRIYDISGRLKVKGLDFQKLIGDLENNKLYIVTYEYKDKNYIYKFIK